MAAFIFLIWGAAVIFGHTTHPKGSIVRTWGACSVGAVCHIDDRRYLKLCCEWVVGYREISAFTEICYKRRFPCFLGFILLFLRRISPLLQTFMSRCCPAGGASHWLPFIKEDPNGDVFSIVCYFRGRILIS